MTLKRCIKVTNWGGMIRVTNDTILWRYLAISDDNICDNRYITMSVKLKNTNCSLLSGVSFTEFDTEWKEMCKKNALRLLPWANFTNILTVICQCPHEPLLQCTTAINWLKYKLVESKNFFFLYNNFSVINCLQNYNKQLSVKKYTFLSKTK